MMNIRKGNDIWIMACFVLLLLVTVELAVIQDAVQGNRTEKTACMAISKRIGDLTDEVSQDDSGEMDSYTVRSLAELLSAEQRLEWAKSFWSYDLYIDDRWIPQDLWKSGMEIEAPVSGWLVIRFIQKEKARTLPLAWHLEGCLTGKDAKDSCETHLSVVTRNAVKMIKTVKTDKITDTGASSFSSIDTVVTFSFNDLVPGTPIRIAPDPVLQKYLMSLPF